jgi:A/G-specific adenine glycosylase
VLVKIRYSIRASPLIREIAPESASNGTLDRLSQATRHSLVEWGLLHRRVYPWRETRDPYRVLLAEILLHRTRADQVVPVYSALLKEYPDAHALASADVIDLRLKMSSLGLRWRIPLLVQCFQSIVQEHGGLVPNSREMLERLPGVGPYIAGAVLCFAFGSKEALLDTNTVRVSGRFYGIAVTDNSRRSALFREMVGSFIDGADPRSANFALLDLAAALCRPAKPKCGECPLRPTCTYAVSASNLAPP